MSNRALIEDAETRNVHVDQGHLLHYDLTSFHLPGGEHSPPLARDLFDGEGRAGGPVVLPVPCLTHLAAIGHFFADTALQFLLRLHITEAAGSHR